MEAIMIAGVAVVTVGGWYSTVDMLADLGIRIGKKSGADVKKRSFSNSCHVPMQRGVKQMAGVNI